MRKSACSMLFSMMGCNSSFCEVAEKNEKKNYSLRDLMPNSGDMFVSDSFIAQRDYSRKTPRWVLEKLDPNSINGVANRKGVQFKSDESIPSFARVKNSDYFDSGYSRGHMAAAGHHKLTQDIQASTFLLENNIIPQEISNNGSDWYLLECFSRMLAHHYEDVYALNVPLYLHRPMEHDGPVPHFEVKERVIGSAAIHVPTHIMKIILVGKRKKPQGEEKRGEEKRGEGSKGEETKGEERKRESEKVGFFGECQKRRANGWSTEIAKALDSAEEFEGPFVGAFLTCNEPRKGDFMDASFFQISLSDAMRLSGLDITPFLDFLMERGGEMSIKQEKESGENLREGTGEKGEVVKTEGEEKREARPDIERRERFHEEYVKRAQGRKQENHPGGVWASYLLSEAPYESLLGKMDLCKSVRQPVESMGEERRGEERRGRERDVNICSFFSFSNYEKRNSTGWRNYGNFVNSSSLEELEKNWNELGEDVRGWTMMLNEYKKLKKKYSPSEDSKNAIDRHGFFLFKENIFGFPSL